MTSIPELKEFKEAVLARFDRLEQKLDDHSLLLASRMDKQIVHMDDWEERFIKMSKNHLVVCHTMIIAAAFVVIWGKVLEQYDVLIEGFVRLFGK